MQWLTIPLGVVLFAATAWLLIHAWMLIFPELLATLLAIWM